MTLPLVLAVAAASTFLAIEALLASPVAGRLRSEPRPNNPATTPQIGGLAAIPAAMALLPAISGMDGGAPALLAGVAAMFVLGLADDLRPLRAAVKFAAQWIIVLAFIAFADLPRLAPALPQWAEAIAIAVLLVWFVNMTNFMDGMDLMTVTGFGIPLAFAGLSILTIARTGTPVAGGTLALLLAATLGGFAQANRPKARAYLGDSGSLALGLAGGVAAIELAAHAGIAALAPFSYYLADSLLTLVRRAAAGESVWLAHQRHAYQAALSRGVSPWRIAILVAAQSAFAGAICLAAVNGFVAGPSAALVAAASALGLVLYLRPGRS
jgi:UDP-N-acetylmuramyl pentapeptide phosphotransferase/UDP-N-acetylglucosamine-1-phosphate transferase